MTDFFIHEREGSLDRITWCPSSHRELYFLEGKVEDGASVFNLTPGNFRHGKLQDGEIEAWLERKDPIPVTWDHGPSFLGVRLLFIDIGNRGNQKVYQSKECYLATERLLDLHISTLPMLFKKGGVYCAFHSSHPGTGTLERIHILIRSPQGGATGNRFLSMTHNFSTGQTTGILAGDGALEPQQPNVGYKLQLDAVLALFQSTIRLWKNPLLLPSILLWTHATEFDRRSLLVENDLKSLEISLGLANEERGTSSRQSQDWLEAIDVKSTLVQIHSAAKRTVVFGGLADWQHKCVEFLQGQSTIIEKSRGNNLSAKTDQLPEALQHLTAMTDGIDRWVSAMQQRVQMQINALYSAASQKDNVIALKYSKIAQEQNVLSLQNNELNTKIATSSKRDSVSIMTFTFITAFFLPGTYIATLFSMSMFNWQLGSNGSDNQNIDGTLSHQFWIYWVVTGPLTIAVLVIWFFWSRSAELAWRREIGLLSK